jgi:hypothetical protein
MVTPWTVPHEINDRMVGPVVDEVGRASEHSCDHIRGEQLGLSGLLLVHRQIMPPPPDDPIRTFTGLAQRNSQAAEALSRDDRLAQDVALLLDLLGSLVVVVLELAHAAAASRAASGSATTKPAAACLATFRPVVARGAFVAASNAAIARQALAHRTATSRSSMTPSSVTG